MKGYLTLVKYPFLLAIRGQILEDSMIDSQNSV